MYSGHDVICRESRVVVRKRDVCEDDLGKRLINGETVSVGKHDPGKLADLGMKRR